MVWVVSSLAVPGSIPLRMSTVAIKKKWQKNKNNPNRHFNRGVGTLAPIFKGMHNPINKLGTAKLQVFWHTSGLPGGLDCTLPGTTNFD